MYYKTSNQIRNSSFSTVSTLTAIVAALLSLSACVSNLVLTEAQNKVEVIQAKNAKIYNQIATTEMNFDRGLPNVVRFYNRGENGGKVLERYKEIVYKEGNDGLILSAYKASMLTSDFRGFSFKYVNPSREIMVKNIAMVAESEMEKVKEGTQLAHAEGLYWTLEYAKQKNDYSFFDETFQVYREYLNKVRLYNKGKCQALPGFNLEHTVTYGMTECEKAVELPRHIQICEDYIKLAAKQLAKSNSKESLKKQYEILERTTNRTTYEDSLINLLNELLI